MANPHPLPSPATTFAADNQPCDGEDKLSPLAQLKRMQRALYKVVTSDQEDPRINASCACAWERLEARKAVLCGKPGSLTGKADPPKRKAKEAPEGAATWKPVRKRPAAAAPVEGAPAPAVVPSVAPAPAAEPPPTSPTP